MKRIIIFSGTTEGRALSELLAGEKISHTVCVATDYGRDLMEESPYCAIRIGRMNEGEMEELFQTAACLVVDATHPYATEVTDNLREAAQKSGAEYIRVLRSGADAKADGSNRYDGILQCADAMEKTEGNILLTTGSKELGSFMEQVSEKVRQRTFVRVLPSVESLTMCEKAGVRPDHVIALQGPFDRQLNEALMRQYDIRHLITKDGGGAGGFREKLDAAENVGALVHVISRPRTEEGMSLEQAYKLITGRELPLQVTLAGLGMGSASGMTIEAAKAIEDADLIFGAKRLLQGINHAKKTELYRAANIIPVLEKEKPQKAVIVFSGDTGFYSGAKGMKQALLEWRSDCRVEVLPGISSFAYLAAKLGESYEDTVLFSLHGKTSGEDLGRLIERVLHESRVFALLSGAKDVALIAERLISRKADARIVTGENLSYENEKIRDLSLEEAMRFEGEGIISVMIRNQAPQKRCLMPVREDADFIREQVPMTKDCIRHESILRLRLREGDLVYDIGGGTGSVAIEAAGIDQSLRVVTIEKKKEAAGLIQRNIEKSGLSNITLREGDAEDVLPGMEKPDCVFIGGSGGKLSTLLSILREKGDGIRVVANAVSLETLEEIRSCIAKFDAAEVDMKQLSVTEIKEAGSYHMLSARNPVWIISFIL